MFAGFLHLCSALKVARRAAILAQVSAGLMVEGVDRPGTERSAGPSWSCPWQKEVKSFCAREGVDGRSEVCLQKGL